MSLGEVPRGVALLALSATAAFLVSHDARQIPFFICLWLYQALDARHLQPSAEAVAEARRQAQRWAPRLVGLGLLFLCLTLLSERLPRPQFLIPGLLIAAGGRLLYTYFRSPEEST